MIANDHQAPTPAPDDARARIAEIQALMQAWSSERFTSTGHTPAARSLVADAGLELLDVLAARDADLAAARTALAEALEREQALREAAEVVAQWGQRMVEAIQKRGVCPLCDELTYRHAVGCVVYAAPIPHSMLTAEQGTTGGQGA